MAGLVDVDSIQSVGFPIVAFFCMFFLVQVTLVDNTKAMKSLEKTLRQTQEENTKALNSLGKALIFIEGKMNR